MDKKLVFRCDIMHEDSSVSKAYASLSLPATPYELRDAIERAHLDDGAEPYIEIMDHTGFPFLEPYLEDGNDLYALNALAEKQATLEPWQIDVFEGLLLMEDQKREPYGLPRIYDLAASAKEGACQVLYNVRTDAELGDFYAFNGFVPEVENLSDTVYELLDMEKIGKKMREGECGVFLRHAAGYVTQTGDLIEEFKTLDLTPKVPDYAVLLEVGLPCRGDPILLKLPCSRNDLEAVPKHFEARGWCDLTWRCADCRIPSLCDAVSMTDNIVFINFAAKQLAEIPEEQLKGCKALIEAAGVHELSDATELLEHMEEYIFSPRFDSPEAVARDELVFMLGEGEAELAFPYVNLHSYGQKLMEAHFQKMTMYGMIEREDKQPFQTMRESQRQQVQPATGRMEMMQM